MLQIASYTNIGGRAQNEDAVQHVLQDRDRLCLVVADGLGGHGGGSLASAAAVKTICQGWRGAVDKNVLTDLIREANRQVLALQTRQCAMKTTAVVLTLEPERAVWAHVGDSRLYHFQDGRLVFQTRDHSASQIAVMLGDITVDQIRFHEDRNRVLRALGQEDTVNVEVKEQPLAPGRHAFLLCTDGFWEYVLEKEMQQDLLAAADPQDWLSRMRKRLLSRVPGNNDNNTAAAVWADMDG